MGNKEREIAGVSFLARHGRGEVGAGPHLHVEHLARTVAEGARLRRRRVDLRLRAGLRMHLGDGFDALVQSALKGKGAMPAQSGGDFDDTEIARGDIGSSSRVIRICAKPSSRRSWFSNRLARPKWAETTFGLIASARRNSRSAPDQSKSNQ